MPKRSEVQHQSKKIATGWTQDQGSSARLDNTVWRGLREEWTINSSSWGSASLTEFFYIQYTGQGDLLLHLGRNYNTNCYQVKPKRTMSWKVFHKNVCPLGALAEEWRYLMNLHFHFTNKSLPFLKVIL